MQSTEETLSMTRMNKKRISHTTTTTESVVTTTTNQATAKRQFGFCS